MSEWNLANFQEALVNVYDRASRDSEYRRLCVNDPVAAIKAVSDIEIPPNPNIRFFEGRENFVHSYKLPDLINPDLPRDDQTRELIRSLIICTQWPTTIMS